MTKDKGAKAKRRPKKTKAKAAKLKAGKSKGLCEDCPYPLVEQGKITRWKDARRLKVKSKKKACKHCPARDVLV